MEKTFLQSCLDLEVNQIYFQNSVSFEELFDLKYPPKSVALNPENKGLSVNLLTNRIWYNYRVTAKTKKDCLMYVWNQMHPVSENTRIHKCSKDSEVLVWMISSHGDVGITDNLENPTGYNCRVVIDDLYDWRIERIK